MKILISNDDGVSSLGIRTLASEASIHGHEVTVVAPDQERSATGHGLTLQNPIRVEQANELYPEGVISWSCSGTPADCIKIALSELLPSKPDLVLSGINHGPNLGTDIFCSGTVAAAMEGTLEGLPSMAVSIACYKWRDFKGAAQIALDVAQKALNDQWPSSLLLNLNIPPCIPEKMGSLGWSRLSIRRYEEQFSKRQDPRGSTYFWLAGEVVKDLESAGDGPREWPSDVAQIESNGPSLTPIQPDLFWRGPLENLPNLNFS